MAAVTSAPNAPTPQDPAQPGSAAGDASRPAGPPAPPMDPRARVAALFDRVADTYENVGVPWFVPIAEGLVDLVAPRPGETAVDLGCGQGAALIPLAHGVGPTGRVTGVDLSPGMVAVARRRLADRGLSAVDLRVMDAAAPDLPPATADVVIASLVLFFIPRPADVLAAWARLLRPGGRLGISTFADRDDAWKRLDDVFTPYLPPQMLDARTSGESGPFASDAGVEGLFTSAGLVGVTTRTVDVKVRFPDVDAWVTWSRSHGQRGMWEQVPEDARPGVLDRAGAILAQAAAPSGGTTLTQQVRYTLGSAPL